MPDLKYGNVVKHEITNPPTSFILKMKKNEIRQVAKSLMMCAAMAKAIVNESDKPEIRAAASGAIRDTESMSGILQQLVGGGM
jgi:hypothetical protein